MILNAVVASDKTNGIGFTEAQYGNANVSLPWKLDGEFKYFMDVCTFNKVRDSSIINPRFIIQLFGKMIFWAVLTVVQTQAILFLESMSEIVGSDIERHSEFE